MNCAIVLALLVGATSAGHFESYGEGFGGGYGEGHGHVEISHAKVAKVSAVIAMLSALYSLLS
ncbi:hypothetical protein BIW11_04116 [Tropilaelaps mercedesae]|uniref:Uncharacterized protein n=1 Tax=Tropilaelaps mercedesae TaxID=418985 RepID=A0A1V9XB86_9ACAR|nr:hypothetical protein BIW11_04116 [Tropilaelaps mercedesae]